MIHMFSLWLSLLIVLSINITNATNLRCNEDINGSFQIVRNCRACIIFIVPVTLSTTSETLTTTTTTSISSRNTFSLYFTTSMKNSSSFSEKKRRFPRNKAGTKIYRQCARELDGPLYGYDQTHCYCNSNRCNSNIQRCIYEVTSIRHFACYHGRNSSRYPLEIHHKCRSCRIRIDPNLMYYYECLTFGERKQSNRTHCTCQRPMCNQDVSTCQRFQSAPSQPRRNPIVDFFFDSVTSSSSSPSSSSSIPTAKTMSTSTINMTNTILITTTATVMSPNTSSTNITDTATIITATITAPTTALTSTTVPTTTTSAITRTTSSNQNPTTAATTTTTSIVNTTLFVITTPITTKLSAIIKLEDEIATKNATIIELTTKNETTTSFIAIKHLKTTYIESKNHANYLTPNFIFNFYFIPIILCLFIYSM